MPAFTSSCVATRFALRVSPPEIAPVSVLSKITPVEAVTDCTVVLFRSDANTGADGVNVAQCVAGVVAQPPRHMGRSKPEPSLLHCLRVEGSAHVLLAAEHTGPPPLPAFAAPAPPT